MKTAAPKLKGHSAADLKGRRDELAMFFGTVNLGDFDTVRRTEHAPVGDHPRWEVTFCRFSPLRTGCRTTFYLQ